MERIRLCLFIGSVLMIAFQFDILKRISINLVEDSELLQGNQKKFNKTSTPVIAATSNNNVKNINKNINDEIASNNGEKEDTIYNNEDSNDSRIEISACLLVKDDNKILWEWLAYHVFVLPLKYLFLAVDPRSETSPLDIVNQFRPYANITVWNDADFGFHLDKLRNRKRIINNAGLLLSARQHTFLSACLNQLHHQHYIDAKKQKQKDGSTLHSWALIVDSDEFISFNNIEPIVGSEGTPQDCKFMLPQDSQACKASYTQQLYHTNHPRSRLPHIGQQTIAGYIQSNPQIFPSNQSCNVLPRSVFKGTESSAQEIASVTIPPGFDPLNFMTLRYRKHGDMQSKLPGKSIVHMNALPLPGGNFSFRVTNPHNVLESCGGPFVNHFRALFRIHHYIGSEQVFLTRRDSRRSIHVYRKRNNVYEVGASDSVRLWLSSLVSKIGHDRAWNLTEGLRLRILQEEEQLSEKYRHNKTWVLMDASVFSTKRRHDAQSVEQLAMAFRQLSIPFFWYKELNQNNYNNFLGIPFRNSSSYSSIMASIEHRPKSSLNAGDVVIVLQDTACPVDLIKDGVRVYIWLLRANNGRRSFNQKAIEQGCQFLVANHWLSNADKLNQTHILQPYISSSSQVVQAQRNLPTRERIVLINQQSEAEQDHLEDICTRHNCTVMTLPSHNRDRQEKEEEDTEQHRSAMIVFVTCFYGYERDVVESVLWGAILITTICAGGSKVEDMPLPVENVLSRRQVYLRQNLEQAVERVLANYPSEYDKLEDFRDLYRDKINESSLQAQVKELYDEQFVPKSELSKK